MRDCRTEYFIPLMAAVSAAAAACIEAAVRIEAAVSVEAAVDYAVLLLRPLTFAGCWQANR